MAKGSKTAPAVNGGASPKAVKPLFPVNQNVKAAKAVPVAKPIQHINPPSGFRIQGK